MDALSEIRRKMDSGDTILVAAATDDLINNIAKSKFKGTRTDMTNIPEMLLLQEYCCHQNPVICNTAFRALCTFMTSNDYQNQLLIDWLVVLSPQTKCKSGFIQEIFELIVFLLKNGENKNKEHVNTLIDLIIKIMDSNLDEWHAILFHMKVHTDFENHVFIKNWLNVTKRLFKFIFLSRTPSNYRTSFVRLFVEILCIASDYDLLFEIYSWLLADNLDDTLFLYNFLEEFCDKIPDTLPEIKYNLCLCITQTSIQLIAYGFDPTQMLHCLNKLLIICPCTSNIMLLCISRSLSLCPSKFVLKIINFCLQVMRNYGCHEIIAQAIVASVLQWNRSKIIDDDTMNLLMSIVNSDVTRYAPHTLDYDLSPFLASDSFLITAYALIKLCPKFDSKQFMSKWLSEIDEISVLLNDTQFNFYLAGLYLSRKGDRTHQQTMLKLMSKKILLPLVAYIVDLETNYYNRFDLMKAIPTTACVQENMSLIISLIKRFENSNEEPLNILSIDMYYNLWMTEVRCYRFLLYCLSKDKPGWQWNVVKSNTLKKLAKSNPNSDLVPVLKQMLGSYIKQSMHLPTKLTLESLVDLCLSEYLNPETLIKIIDKSISDIYHPAVISSYCNLLAVSINQTTEKIKQQEYFKKLWSMVLHPNEEAIKCALKALSDTDVENLSLNALPEKFRSFPKFVIQFLENSERINLFNGPVPGECWVKFLQNISQSVMEEAQHMLSVWLRQELKTNVIPRIQSDYEPKNLKHLPNHSIARGLLSFVVPKRKNMLDAEEDTKLACLAVINGADKPMFSFDWCFLDKYVTEGPNNKLWRESVVLIAKQSTSSTSAFRLLHKCYQHHSSFNNIQKKILISVLFKVSSIIYHDLQKKFVTEVVNEVLNKIVTNDTYSASNSNVCVNVDLLCHILSEFKQILQSPEAHIENVNFICDILGNIWCTINVENKKILYAFLDCSLSMPIEALKLLKPYPIQESMVFKFVILGCAQNFISSNVSFNELNECIQACNQFFKSDYLLYDSIIEVFKLKIFIPYHNEFFANFMIHLASYTKHINSSTNNSFGVLCSIFIKLVIAISGFDSINCSCDKKQNNLIFPIALATLSKNSSQSPRIIEWLKTMRTIKALPEEYSTLFYCCLVALKNDKSLLEWTNRKKIVLNR